MKRAMERRGGRREELERLRSALGADGLDLALLQEATTHSSYANERPGEGLSHNERLEFLGDAVLGLIIAEHLFKALPGRAEGRLAKLKARLVSEPVLARLAGRLALGSYLLLGRGEELTGGRKRVSILADALEAVIGACYLSLGWEETRRLVLAWWEEELTGLASGEEVLDAKSALQELTQAEWRERPEYRVIGEEGPDHQKKFCVEVWLGERSLGRGEGRTKKAAEQAAARVALAALQGSDKADHRSDEGELGGGGRRTGGVPPLSGVDKE
ncbi:MAG: ribonuclease III [Bacillota bacterium]|nr:ribonuclease III [Bacillota bacterium]